jgi:hypothetical protein
MDRAGAGVFAAAIALLCGGACSGEQPRCSAWELVNPRPQANHLRDVAFGGGRWVAVGEGVAVVSTDAVTWSAVPLPDRSLRGVTYGDGVFVAAGAGSAIVRSGDGAEWESIDTPASADLEAVAFAAGTFLAVGDAATVLASVDGLSWTPESPGAVTGDLAGVRVSGRFAGNPGPMFLVWGPSSIALRRLDGTWLAIPLPQDAEVTRAPFWVNSAICATLRCGEHYWCTSTSTLFLVTHDGVAWEPLEYGLVIGPSDVAVKGKGLVGLVDYELGSVTALYTTPDGWSWSPRESAFNVRLRALAAAAGRFVAVGDHGVVFTSMDGTTWSSATGPSPDLYRLAWNEQAFAANASGRGTNAEGWETGIPSQVASRDGRDWSIAAASDIDVVAARLGQFLGVRAQEVHASADGLAWARQPDLPTWGAPGALWDGQRFAILTFEHSPNCQVTCVPVPIFAATSEDLAMWVAVEQPDLLDLGHSRLAGMAFDGRRYVAAGGVNPTVSEPSAGRHPVFTSADGLNWGSLPEIMPGTKEGTSAIATNGRGFVAVRGTSVLTSPNGLDWSSADIAPLHLIRVMWTGDEYVAVGDDGAGHAAVARSTNGTAWTHEAFPAIPARLLAVTGGQRVQLAVGQAGVTLRRECHPQSPSRRLRGAR